MKELPAAPMGVDELTKKLGITETELETRIKAGKLPRPSMFEGRRVWMRIEIAKAMESGTAIRCAVVKP